MIKNDTKAKENEFTDLKKKNLLSKSAKSEKFTPSANFVQR